MSIEIAADSLKPAEVIVEITAYATAERAWTVFTEPAYIKKWNFASPDWHCPEAENNLTESGLFNYRMESKDGKYGFDFSGTYTKIIKNKNICFQLGDFRKVRVDFMQNGDRVTVRETFDAEKSNPVELQKNGWQSILTNYKKVLESGYIS